MLKFGMMNEKVALEFARKAYRDTLKVQDDAFQDYMSGRRADVGGLRSLIVQISVLSLGAVGFSIPVLGKEGIVQSPILFASGLLFLSISAVLGLWHSVILMENSIISGWEGWKRVDSHVQISLSNIRFLLENPDKLPEYLKKLRGLEKGIKSGSGYGKIKRDRFVYIVLSFFTIGLFLIFLSVAVGLAPAFYCRF